MPSTPRTHLQQREEDAHKAAQQEAQAYGLFVSQFLFALPDPGGQLTPFNGGPDVTKAAVVWELLTEYVSDAEALRFIGSMLTIVGLAMQERPCPMAAQGVAQALAHAYAREATQQALERGDLPLV